MAKRKQPGTRLPADSEFCHSDRRIQVSPVDEEIVREFEQFQVSNEKETIIITRTKITERKTKPSRNKKTLWIWLFLVILGFAVDYVFQSSDVKISDLVLSIREVLQR